MSDTKIKEGIFIGPQIRELMQDKQFDEDQNETERNACLSFKRICKDFLRNHKAANYQDVVQDLLTLYTSCGMQYESEIPLSGVTLGFFSPETLAKSVTNTVKRFHQEVMTVEKRYQGKWTSSMLADYCWTLKMDVLDAKYRRKSCLFILEESFCLFHEHVKYYTAHLNSSVYLRPRLIENFCIHI